MPTNSLPYYCNITVRKKKFNLLTFSKSANKYSPIETKLSRNLDVPNSKNGLYGTGPD